MYVPNWKFHGPRRRLSLSDLTCGRWLRDLGINSDSELQAAINTYSKTWWIRQRGIGRKHLQQISDYADDHTLRFGERGPAVFQADQAVPTISPVIRGACTVLNTELRARRVGRAESATCVGS